jgi:hypothetical protein
METEFEKARNTLGEFWTGRLITCKVKKIHP